MSAMKRNSLLLYKTFGLGISQDFAGFRRIPAMATWQTSSVYVQSRSRLVNKVTSLIDSLCKERGEISSVKHLWWRVLVNGLFSKENLKKVLKLPVMTRRCKVAVCCHRFNTFAISFSKNNELASFCRLWVAFTTFSKQLTRFTVSFRKISTINGNFN